MKKENKLSLTQAEVNRLNKGAKQVNAMRAKEKAEQGKKKKEAPKPVQGAGNMPLDDKQAAQQVDFLKSKNKEKEVKGMKKMNRGGMTAPMMGASGAPESGPKKPMIMPPKRKPAPRPTPVVDPMAKAPNPRMKDPREKGSAMPMMKKGGKVRGAGMAKKGVRACKMR